MFKNFIFLMIFIFLIPFICSGILIYLLIKLICHFIKNILSLLNKIINILHSLVKLKNKIITRLSFKKIILSIPFICLLPFICLGILIYLLIKLGHLIIKTILLFIKVIRILFIVCWVCYSSNNYIEKIMFLVNLGISSILTSVTILYIKKKQFIHLVEDVGANFKYKQNNNLLESVHIYDIFAYVGIITLLIILPFYFLKILEKNNSFTIYQSIKISIIICSVIYLFRYIYNISAEYFSLLFFVNYWCAISLLYNLVVLVIKKIYNWLCDIPHSKPYKPKTNKKLNVAKLTLLWTIIVFILGLIFNIKK